MKERASLVRNCDNSHEETKLTALKRDEQQVQALVDQTMTGPSDVGAHPTCRIHFYTDMHTTKELHDSLLTTVDEGGTMNEKQCILRSFQGVCTILYRSQN